MRVINTTQMLNIFIAEDEPLAAAKLKMFLQKLGETQCMHFEDGISLLAMLEKEKPEVLFLDIQMPGATGLQVMEKINMLGYKNIQIIITSAYDQYAIDSFNYNVTDYLLKPYTLERLESALTKAKNNIRLLNLDERINQDIITIKCEGRSVNISLNDIIYFESLKDYVKIVLHDNRKLLTLGTLSSFENRLNEDFSRVHRSYIINKKAITETDGHSVTMSNGFNISIGKTYRSK